MKIQKNKTVSKKNDSTGTCFWSLNKLIMASDITGSIKSVLAYRIYLNSRKKSLNELHQNRTVQIEIDDIIKGELKGDMYRQLDNALDEIRSLNTKQIEGAEEFGDITYTNVFEQVGYTKRNGQKIIWVTFTQSALQLFEKMSLGGYTKIPSSEVVMIPSIHGTKTYEVLSMLSGFTDNAYFTLDKWKSCIGIPGSKYSRWQHFKQGVVDADKKVINSNTSLSYDYKPKFVKRKVVGVHLINIKNNSKPWGHSFPHVKIVNEHIWPTHRDQILDNYPPEHIEYYHKKCHKIADSGKIADLNSFIYKAITEDKDNYKTLLENKKIKKTTEQKIKEAKEREIAESEHFYNFSKDCYELLSDVQKETYESGIMGFTDRSIVLSVAISKFSEDNEDLLRESKSPEEFISAYNVINDDV